MKGPKIMPMKLYELRGADNSRFSPYSWRARMAIAHKGLEAQSMRVCFSEIKQVCGGVSKTVPVLDDDGTILSGSFAIAEYLDRTYPQKPLFNGASAVAHCRFIEAWANSVVVIGAFPMIARDVLDRVEAGDQAYFRKTRETRLGRTLEEAAQDRDQKRPLYQASLAPLRMMLAHQPFIGGENPDYGDYIVFGTLMWPRIASPFKLIGDDDPIAAWMERCLDLHGGIARAEKPAA